MKHKKKIVISLFISIIILIGIGVFIIFNNKNENKDEIIENTEIEISEKLLTPKEYNEYAFYDIHFGNNQENNEELEITVKNIGKEAKKESWVQISFIGENGEVFARTPVKIFDLQPMETHIIYIDSTENLKKAEDFLIEDTEPPLEMEPEEFE